MRHFSIKEVLEIYLYFIHGKPVVHTLFPGVWDLLSERISENFVTCSLL